MACRIFRISGLIANYAKNNNYKSNAVVVSFLKPQDLLVQNARSTSFFCKLPAKSLWKSVTGISNAGRKRGRGKGAPRTKDLNRGQMIGSGKIPILFPGLNSSVVKGDHLIEMRKLPKSEQKEVPAIQPQVFSRKRVKQHPLERGWTGNIMGGRKLGPPDPVHNEPFTGFETWVLYFTQKHIMSSNMGRVKRYAIIAVTGNGNGLAGFASTSGPEARTSLTLVKNKAGQRLMYFERYDNHTVLHDFFTQFGSTKIFVKQKPKGYGLVCHRVIRTICEAVGITDIYAKVEGSDNIPNLVKAFFIGLLRQKTYQQMANEKKLHLVEFNGKTTFPKVVASPDTVRKPEEIKRNEILDFNQYVMDGKIVLRKKKPLPFYTKLESYSTYIRKMERIRDHAQMRIRLRAEYGDICSFLTEKYPEARVSKWRKHDKTEEQQE
ncbi:mitochondrial ribosomal protein S5 [Calliopsis andreniformis]|uniref:mitochondrial ribosomal protein S5 n=1 Tax=Calliopsis andreniformis TaxID=337506 RepID=UPI003FCDC762